MNEFVVRSPCHPDHRLVVDMWDGKPDGLYCDARGCYNSWDVDGNPL